MNNVKLKIADIIILLQSKFPLESENESFFHSERFNNFLYNGRQKPHIRVRVEMVDKLPTIQKTTHVFVAYHFQDGSENWRLLKKNNTYIYKCPIKGRKQLMLVNKTFNRVKAYILPKKKKAWVWNFTDIIYDFLQVLLINYFALHKKGIFVHGIGVRDLGGKGLLFAGKSGCGKSTSAKLWHQHSQAMVLNDDRIIVRKFKDKFFVHGSPWHGDFSDYLLSRIESAPLEKLFFIHHAFKNSARKTSPKESFNLLYPALFPPFWEKGNLENIVAICQKLVESVPCYNLGFKNNKKIIGFVRNI